MAGTGGMCRDAAGQTYSGCPVLAADEQTCKKILLELAGVPGVRGAMFAPKSSALARAGRSCVLQVDAGAHVNASAVEGGWMAEPCIQGQGSGPIVEAAPNSAEASWSCMKLEGTAFLEGDSEMPCSGVQLYSSTCPVRPCEDQCSPEDCVLSQWSEWSAPSCTQLCERSRVLQKQNECGGKSCDGQLVDTKRCWKNCTAPVDCLFGDWSYWEPLTCVSEVDQKERSRTVLRTAKNGGENCEGPVRETLPCSGTPTLVADCLLGSWADWTACNRPCDQGLRTRSRVVAVQAQGGGQPCDGTLAEMQPCSLGPCERAVRSDGEFAPWSTWGDCSPSNMRVRTRKVAQEPTGGGKAAIGSVEETAECSEIMDCKVSDWTNWDLCDRSCGGGQQQRQRQVQGNPRNGGMKCPANLIETRGCKEEPCRAVDCEVTHWSDWASCSADCGNGYRERQRSIETLAEANGAGCALPLSELGECQGAEVTATAVGRPHVLAPCLVGTWRESEEVRTWPLDWDLDRRAEVSRPAHPEGARTGLQARALECAMLFAQLRVGGLLGNPQSEGPVYFFSAMQLLQAYGLEATRSCTVRTPRGISCVPSQDCEFGGWSVRGLYSWQAWGACSESCDGVKRRSRTIKQQGRGEGAFCEGPLKQTYPCSTGVGLLEFSSPSLAPGSSSTSELQDILTESEVLPWCVFW
ncbi:unnamed protein product [Polarella glacialis]|uniref:Spondin-like TSP1 domain-containing protein n=1 Tax=Polarella glacialis TaxID=89957 RepID=A0A813L095_POLGL|nr:unnamed protein product [Polarella glacialis]